MKKIRKRVFSFLIGVTIVFSLMTFQKTQVKAAGSTETTTKTVTDSKGKVTVNNNLLSVPNSTFTQDTGDWQPFNYSGYGTSKARQSGGGINGYDYMRLTKTGDGDSGILLKVDGLSSNTNYTISGYFRIPFAASSFGNGLIFIVNGANNAGMAQFNRPNTLACDWDQVKGTFNTGGNTSINIRIDTGNFKTIDVTALKLEKGNIATPVESWNSKATYPFEDFNNGQFSSTYNYDDGDYKGTLNAVSLIYTPVSKDFHKDPVYRTDYQTFYKSSSGTYSSKNDGYFSTSYYVNENGYSGNIPRSGVSWSENWETNRRSGTVTGEEYRSSRANDGGGMPSSKSVSVWDSGTGQNVSGNIPLVRNDLTGTSNEFDYDWGYMWWMSNSNTYYDWDGRQYNYAWSSPPKWPEHKYGHWCQDEGLVSSSGWTQYAVRWSKDVDWSTLSGAPPQRPGLEHKDSPQNGDYGPWWSGDMYNDYRQVAVTYYRKPYTAYNFRGNYSGTIALPNRLANYTGTANYSGTLSKQVIDHYNEYYTSNQWNVQVVYTGTVYSYNSTPVAAFKVSTPKLTDETLVYTDSSYANDPWDSIVAREWSYSSDNRTTWSTPTSTPPTSFNLSQFPSSYEKGVYNIRLRVKDKGNTLFPGIWSNYAYQDVTIYRRNTKPTVTFSVNKIQYENDRLSYVVDANARDNWDSITAFEWSYSKDGGNYWTSPSSSPPMSFPNRGNYLIRVRVQDKGNLLSPPMWSDYYTQSVQVIYPLTLLNFRIMDIVNQPKDYQYPIYTDNMPVQVTAGYRVTFDVDVVGIADSIPVDVYINNEKKSTVDMRKKADTDLTFPPKSIWTFDYVVPLETPENSVITCKIKGNNISHNFIFDYNTEYNWNGDSLKTKGTYYNDFMIHRVY